MPAYKLSNNSICDLLYDLCTTNDEYATKKIEVLIEWIVTLYRECNATNNVVRCNNPQSGFVKCISSILWHCQTESQIPNLINYISDDIFDACIYWIEHLNSEEPLKIAFDSLLCSLCYIKPQLFNRLLIKLKLCGTEKGLLVNQSKSNLTNVETDMKSTTMSTTPIDGNDHSPVVVTNLQTLFGQPKYLHTIALASQSINVMCKLIDSNLPQLLALQICNYCTMLYEKYQKQKEKLDENLENNDVSSISQCKVDDSTNAANVTKKCEKDKCQLSTRLIAKILEFFTECCNGGYMRVWLGTEDGTIFWKPLLELLCNHRSIDFNVNLATKESTEQAFIRLERATINFFSKVTVCHPSNQGIFTSFLINVIRQSSLSNKTAPCRFTISGFTRQLILQILLENERILVSVRSKRPMQRKDTTSLLDLMYNSNDNLTTNISGAVHTDANGMPINMMSSGYIGTSDGVITQAVSHHPSKRINAHQLLFNVSTNTRCQDILQQCTSGK